MSYDVGQVLFILHSKTMRIIPLQVVEQNVKRTKVGEEITYAVIETPGSRENDVPFMLQTVAGQVFTNIEEITAAMKKNAIAAIDKLANDAKIRAKSFGASIAVNESITNDSAVQTGMTVELPDGTIAKVNIDSIQ